LCFHWSTSMPLQLNTDLNETLQSILDKSANLQIQLNTNQENHDGATSPLTKPWNLAKLLWKLSTLSSTMPSPHYCTIHLIFSFYYHTTTPRYGLWHSSYFLKHHVFHSTPSFHPFQAVFTTTTTTTQLFQNVATISQGDKL